VIPARLCWRASAEVLVIDHVEKPSANQQPGGLQRLLYMQPFADNEMIDLFYVDLEQGV